MATHDASVVQPDETGPYLIWCQWVTAWEPGYYHRSRGRWTTDFDDEPLDVTDDVLFWADYPLDPTT